MLCDLLAAGEPTVSLLVARAVARAASSAPDIALAQLAETTSTLTSSYQPYLAVRAHALSLLGRNEEAVAAYNRGIGLTEGAAVRNFLKRRRDAVSKFLRM